MALFLTGLHLLALLAVWANPLPLWIKIALSLGVAFGFRLHFSGSGKGLKSPVERLLWHTGQPPWRLTLPDGAEIDAELSGAVVTPWFVVMRWRGGLALLLCRDSLDPDEFRRLRVLLRTRPAAYSGSEKRP